MEINVTKKAHSLGDKGLEFKNIKRHWYGSMGLTNTNFCHCTPFVKYSTVARYCTVISPPHHNSPKSMPVKLLI